MQERSSLHPWADWLVRLCEIDSTSGSEAQLVPLLWEKLSQMGAHIEIQQIQPNRVNILAQWGEPELLFSTHLDTVAPFIPPRREASRIWGRGSCDAKGQIAAQLAAIESLLTEGQKNLAWLGVAGEETDSIGAYAAQSWAALQQPWTALINGEPTQNRLATGQRGVYHVALEVKGVAAHSGTPDQGENALLPLLDWIEQLRALTLAHDAVLGPEIWNLGRVQSPNAPNIVADEARAELLVRTIPQGTFRDQIGATRPEKGSIHCLLDEPPFVFETQTGFELVQVPFGSDAPTLAKLIPSGAVYLFGPGSIEVAHGPGEYLDLEDLLVGVRGMCQLAEAILCSDPTFK